MFAAVHLVLNIIATHKFPPSYRPMTAPQLSRCDQGHKGGTTANHAMSGGVNTRSEL